MRMIGKIWIIQRDKPTIFSISFLDVLGRARSSWMSFRSFSLFAFCNFKVPIEKLKDHPIQLTARLSSVFFQLMGSRKA